MTTENKDSQGNTNEDTRLYAGKFKTVEDLEAGYKNSLPAFQENEQLKTRLKEATEIPASYLNPSDVTLEQDRLSDLQERARDAGMTQGQYEKYVRQENARQNAAQSKFEGMRKEVGEETLNILKDYVGKNYPKEFHDNMLNSFIVNKEARQAALNHRSQLLNSQTPGVNKPSAGGYTVTDEDIQKAYKAKEAARGQHGQAEAQRRYLNLLEARAAQRAG